MIIQCKSCETKFRVGDEKVKPPGIKVRCSKCGEIFFFEYDDRPREPETDGRDPLSVQKDLDEPKPEDTKTLDERKAETTFEGEEDSAKTEPDIAQDGKGIRDEVVEEELGMEGFGNLEIDPLDEFKSGQDVSPEEDIEVKKETEEETQTGSSSVHTQLEKEKIERSEVGYQETRSEFSAPQNLTIDTDKLRETYPTYRTPRTFSDRPSGYFRKSLYRKKSGFFGRSLFWLFLVLLAIVLFYTSMFVLNESNIYPNDYYSKIQNYLPLALLQKDYVKFKGTILITDDEGRWVSSRYGQVYVVSGNIVNKAKYPVNFVKLQSEFLADGNKLYEQEFYSGNTLSNWEIKNKPFNSIDKKLKRKNGDVNYDDVDSLAGLNFDIVPGESIPFYTVFPAKSKVLGLKYRLKVVDFETPAENIAPN